MNKPAKSGTVLPYHQDLSLNWEMTISPTLTIWTALDDATIENGCLEVVPGSHKHGRIGVGHMISTDEEAQHAPAGSSKFLELHAGESVVFHNGTLHRSGVNQTDRPRRAFTMCLMDASAKHKKTGKGYPIIFGPGALTPQMVKSLSRIPPHVYDVAPAQNFISS